MGQAFFTLSLGFSVMIAYSSYLDRDDSLPADGGAIVVINTLVAILAGFVVFPILFATGGAGGASGGPGTAFVALAGAFGGVPGGRILGLLFFVVLLFAALSSSISLLEVPVSFVTEQYGVSRLKGAVGTGGVILLIGIPAALGTNYLTFYNDVVFNLLLPIVVLLLAAFTWVSGDAIVDEIKRGTSLGETFPTVWLWWVRLVVPVAVIVTLYLGLEALYTGLTNGTYF